jgi:hypothetical protein
MAVVCSTHGEYAADGGSAQALVTMQRVHPQK